MCVFFREFKTVFLFVGLSLCNGLVGNAQRPVSFIENKNQWDENIHFVSCIPGGKMLVGPASFKYFFVDHEKLETLHQKGHDPKPDGEGNDQHVAAHAV